MKAPPWIKLHIDILAKTDMMALSPLHFANAIKMMLVVAANDYAGGSLPDSVDQLARALWCSPKEVQESLDVLAGLGFLTQHEGRWYITNWDEYQEPDRYQRSDRYVQRQKELNRERQRRYRNRKKMAEGISAEALPNALTPPEQEAINRAWVETIGTISAHIAQELAKLAEECQAHIDGLPMGAPGADLSGYEWVEKAIRAAANSAQGGRFGIGYVDAILRRWMAEGFQAKSGRRARNDDGVPLDPFGFPLDPRLRGD
jgi:hypothetical protein